MQADRGKSFAWKGGSYIQTTRETNSNFSVAMEIDIAIIKEQNQLLRFFALAAGNPFLPRRLERDQVF